MTQAETQVATSTTNRAFMTTVDAILLFVASTTACVSTTSMVIAVSVSLVTLATVTSVPVHVRHIRRVLAIMTSSLYIDQNLEIKGVMNGTIDIHRADGSVNRVKLTNSQFQGFSMLSLLRAHSAISNVPRELASILNKLIPIGEISAWLFATPSGNAVNGFDFTGSQRPPLKNF